MGRGKAKYPTTLRVRAPKEMEARILRILEAKGYGDPSEFMRDAIAEHLAKEEARLGLSDTKEKPKRSPEK